LTLFTPLPVTSAHLPLRMRRDLQVAPDEGIACRVARRCGRGRVASSAAIRLLELLVRSLELAPKSGRLAGARCSRTSRGRPRWPPRTALGSVTSSANRPAARRRPAPPRGAVFQRGAVEVVAGDDRSVDIHAVR
jgi:hypothetical protein